VSSYLVDTTLATFPLKIRNGAQWGRSVRKSAVQGVSFEETFEGWEFRQKV
jgi:hypothetical protein